MFLPFVLMKKLRHRAREGLPEFRLGEKATLGMGSARKKGGCPRGSRIESGSGP